MSLPSFLSFGIGVEASLRVLVRAVGAGVFLEVLEVPDLGRFSLLEFWLAEVEGVLC